MRVLLVIVLILSICNLAGLGWLLFHGPAAPPARGPAGRIGPPLGGEFPPQTAPGGPRRAHRFGPEGRRGGPRWLRPEREKQIRRVLAKYYPELDDQLRSPGGKGPHGAGLRRLLRDNWRHIFELVEADREDPELAERLVQDHRLSRELDRLSREYRRSPNEQKEKIEGQMRKLLEEQFEKRQWIRHRRLERLAKQIEELRNDLTSREEHREELINQQLRRRIKPGEEGLPNW